LRINDEGIERGCDIMKRRKGKKGDIKKGIRERNGKRNNNNNT